MDYKSNLNKSIVYHTGKQNQLNVEKYKECYKFKMKFENYNFGSYDSLIVWAKSVNNTKTFQENIFSN